jgi:TonB family protein
MNRFIFLVIVSAMLAPLLSASQTSDRQEVIKRIEQAVSKTDIFELPSFQMRADVQIDNRGKPLDGSYELLWNGPNQWREQITFPGYTEVEVGGTGIVWIKRTTDFIPFHVYHVHAVLGFGFGVPSGGFGDLASYTQLCLTLRDTIKKVSSEKRHGEKVTCFDIESEHKVTSEICINDTTGIIARDSPFEDTNFQAVGGKSFPRFLSYEENHKKVAKVNIRELITPVAFPPNTFDPPQGTSSQAGCMNPMPSRIVRKVAPQYPETARRNRVEGSVGIDVRIGLDGVPTINTVVASPSSDLAKSSIEAIKDWRYEPATCDGKPVEVETVLTVNYVLR